MRREAGRRTGVGRGEDAGEDGPMGCRRGRRTIDGRLGESVQARRSGLRRWAVVAESGIFCLPTVDDEMG